MKQLILISLFLRDQIHLLSVGKAKREMKRNGKKRKENGKQDRILSISLNHATTFQITIAHTHTSSNHFDYEINSME